jgi:hypothetical protein
VPRTAKLRLHEATLGQSTLGNAHAQGRWAAAEFARNGMFALSRAGTIAGAPDRGALLERGVSSPRLALSRTLAWLLASFAACGKAAFIEMVSLVDRFDRLFSC